MNLCKHGLPPIQYPPNTKDLMIKFLLWDIPHAFGKPVSCNIHTYHGKVRVICYFHPGSTERDFFIAQTHVVFATARSYPFRECSIARFDSYRVHIYLYCTYKYVYIYIYTYGGFHKWGYPNMDGL